MSTTKKNPKSKEFELGHYRFHRDERGHLVMIPSGPEVEGFLAFDMEENHFVQVHLLKTGDVDKCMTYKAIWQRNQEKNDCTICPSILAHGEEDSVPYYVSSLPAGEPVSFFIKRSGPLPPEVAVKMVLKFLRSLRAQNPVAYEQFEMCPETLWIARSPKEPRIVFGDFSPIPHPQAEGANAHLCLDLLKYLSGNPPFNEVFQELVTVLERGPQTIGFSIEKLEDYINTNPPATFWTDFNQPSPMLHQLVPPEVAMQTSLQESSKSPYDRPLWQYVLGIGATAAVFGVVAMLGLIYFTKRDPQPIVKSSVFPKPVAVEEQPLESFPEPVEAEVMEPAPVDFAEVETEEPATTFEPPLPPLPSLEQETEEEETVMAPLEVAENLVEEMLPPLPEKVEALSIEIPDPTSDNSYAKSERDAASARAEMDYVKAIGHEIEFLKQEPKSIEARMRLNGDLMELKKDSSKSFTAADVDVIQQSAAYNPKAHDILVQHYRNTGNWNLEIATLVNQGRNSRPDKLREAGERIFQSPGATDGDHKAAREYFVEAAKAGDAGAQFFAGECMILGRGGSKNLAQGTYYLRKAIDKGDARAMDLLGVCYVRGWGVRGNDSRAVELFQAAIDGGNIPAYYNLGARYAQGQGVERDAEKAAELFSIGSDKGNASCMLVLARCYEAGYGREQDPALAAFWFSKSAEKGNVEAIKWCTENEVNYQKLIADSL